MPTSHFFELRFCTENSGRQDHPMVQGLHRIDPLPARAFGLLGPVVLEAL